MQLKYTYNSVFPGLQLRAPLPVYYHGANLKGYQGQEKDDEIKGSGNSVNYTYRMHDPRLGRFLSLDPLTATYPFYSPYIFSGNRVVDCIELEGLEPLCVNTFNPNAIIFYNTDSGNYGGKSIVFVRSDCYAIRRNLTANETRSNPLVSQLLHAHKSGGIAASPASRTTENFAYLPSQDRTGLALVGPPNQEANCMISVTPIAVYDPSNPSAAPAVHTVLPFNSDPANTVSCNVRGTSNNVPNNTQVGATNVPVASGSTQCTLLINSGGQPEDFTVSLPNGQVLQTIPASAFVPGGPPQSFTINYPEGTTQLKFSVFNNSGQPAGQFNANFVSSGPDLTARTTNLVANEIGSIKVDISGIIVSPVGNNGSANGTPPNPNQSDGRGRP